MSYDFALFSRSLGGDLLAQAHARAESDEEEINPGDPTTEAEQRKATLTQALTAANPTLTPFVFGFAEIAKRLGIAEAEARIRYRHVELNGPENGNGIQIVLFDDSASVTVPYWHKDAAATAVFDEIWSYLEILQREGNFATFDPQLDKILDLGVDKAAAIAAYAGVVDKMGQVLAFKGKKPWWKFW